MSYWPQMVGSTLNPDNLLHRQFIAINMWGGILTRTWLIRIVEIVLETGELQRTCDADTASTPWLSISSFQKEGLCSHYAYDED